MAEYDPLQEVYAVIDVSDADFDAGKAWMDTAHPYAHSFQGDHFMRVADLQGEGAESQQAMSDAWKPLWRDGVVEGDAACVWGEVDWFFHLGDDHYVARCARSLYYVKVGGDWRALFTHFTVLKRARA
jgi:hypothetical protein